MSKKERMMDEAFAFSVIERSKYGTMAISSDDYPYSINLSFVLIEKRLFFHTGKSGKKLDLLNKNN